MANLREKMARHGFESNDDYDFQIRCLLQQDAKGIRCLNVDGDADRRKTAFATALAHALDYPRILYHDFTQQHPPLPDVILPPSTDEQGREEPPIDPFDQVLSEACAFSEAEDTILIVDQLQVADFREHIRIYHFLESACWTFRDAAYYANPAHLLVFLVSEQPLYHSLQKLSFRVWVNRDSTQAVNYRPEEFGLEPDAAYLMDRLVELFVQLGTAPTRSEYGRILEDILHRVRTVDTLRHSIYGWTENVERDALHATRLQQPLEAVMVAVENYLGVDEVEISSS